MTDRPGKPDTEPHLPHVEPSGPELGGLDIPGAPPLPAEFSTKPPDVDLLTPEPRDDPMQHAPKWGRHLHERVDGVFDRLRAIEEALRLMSTSAEVDHTTRATLVADISHVMAKYVDSLLADNQVIKQELSDLDSRLKIAEGKIEQMRSK